jgi:uncharacterized NAD(P)/FAD-binding protein YdhS
MPRTLLIVGAGFSGTVLAVNLLRRAKSTPIEIVLVERGTAIGRGVAYAARAFPFLLNVPAARLSADSADPLSFLRFAQRRLPHTDGEDFLPRSLYGDYLQDLLAQAEQAAGKHVTLRRVFGEVDDINEVAGERGLSVHLADGSTIRADFAVLALGNPASSVLSWAESIRHHEAYRHDPWDLPQHLSDRHSVLIVGSGLTMADAAVALSQDIARAPKMRAISRRGLLPQPQTIHRSGVVKGDGAALLAHAHSLKNLLAASRALAREVEMLGGDWREAITFIRALAPRLWQQLPQAERLRFIRHVQPHWGIHRHRVPPQIDAHIADLKRGGKLHVSAGRIDSVEVHNSQLRVSWRPRGSHVTSTWMVDLIINATGPDYALNRSTDPLLKAMRTSGLVSADPLNLGIRTADHGACVSAAGIPSKQLFYLGPMLRADYWEATAATEIRDHAERLADHLLS